jgi:hypothetical protein
MFMDLLFRRTFAGAKALRFINEESARPQHFQAMRISDREKTIRSIEPISDPAGSKVASSGHTPG